MNFIVEICENFFSCFDEYTYSNLYLKLVNVLKYWYYIPLFIIMFNVVFSKPQTKTTIFSRNYATKRSNLKLCIFTNFSLIRLNKSKITSLNYHCNLKIECNSPFEDLIEIIKIPCVLLGIGSWDHTCA